MTIIAVPKAQTHPPVVNAYWSGGAITLTVQKPDGANETRRVPAEHVCFLRAKDIDDEMMRRFRADGRVASIRPEGEWLRVRWRDYGAVYGACEWLHSKFIPTFEADVDPVKRYLADSGATIAKPRRCFIDIETDSRAGIAKAIRGEARVLSWALVDDQGEKVVGLLEADTNEAERELLLDFWHEVAAYDQIVGWNLDRFDKPALLERSKALGMNVEARRWLWLDHLLIFKRMNISASKSGDEKQSMALDAIAMSLKVGGKLEGVDASKSWELWQSDPQLLARYNLRDAELMPLIEQASGYLAVHQVVCETCGVLPDSRAAKPTRFVDGFLLRRARERGMHFPTKFYGKEKDYDDEADPFKGAWVMEPTKLGIVRDVHVADFKSMYPSIIISFNMSPETYDDGVVLDMTAARPVYLSHVPPERQPIPSTHCAAPDDTCFRLDVVGLVAEACAEFLSLRKFWSDERSKHPPGSPKWKDADRRATAMKAVPNSFFGVLGNEMSRYFLRAVAQAITQTGAWLAKETFKAGELRRLEAIYGDTDSLFIVGCSDAEFRAFVAECNSVLYPRLLKEQNCKENRIKLGYEKKFERVILVTKKRYAGRYSHYDGTSADEDSEPEVKGLEYKRGDTAKLARGMQAEVIDLLVGGGILRKRVAECEEREEVFVELVKRWRDRILNGELELKDFVLSKSLSKELDEYAVKKKKDGTDQAGSPHVAIARLLEKRGLDVGEGTKIEYVVTDASESPMKAIPASDFAGEKDRHYLWETLAYPATQRVLEVVFPAGPWRQFEKSRPPKLRGISGRAQRAGQLGLFGKL
jgi:DNA polymerase I